MDKPHADSKLKILPEERQDEIAEYATENTLRETVRWLGAGGLETSVSALSRFLSWYRLKEQMARNEAAVSELLADMVRRDPALTADRLHEIGHMFFAGLALENQDARGWCMMQRIVLKKAQLQLDTDKYRDIVQAQKEALERGLQAAKASGGLSPETIKKIEQELNLG